MLTYKINQNISLQQWNDILHASQTGTFFQSEKWITNWVENFGGKLEILEFADNDKTVALGVFDINQDIVTFAGSAAVEGNQYVSDFGDIICIKGYEGEVWKQILDHFSNKTLDLFFLREDSPSLEILKTKASALTEADVSPSKMLPKTWEEYLSSLERHDRHELKRKIRKLEAEGGVKECSGANDTDVEEFFRLMELSSDNKKHFLNKKMKDFFRSIFNKFAGSENLGLCFMKIGEKNIAAILSFYFKNRFYLYNSGYDPEYRNISPGLILKAYSLKHAIENGAKFYDFLRGNERYKYNLGAVDAKLFKLKIESRKQ